MNIVLVDDEKNIRRIYEKILHQIYGHNVKTLDKYEGFVPGNGIDVYILDFNIRGGCTGYEWLKYVGDDLVPANQRILSSGTGEWEEFGVAGIIMPKPIDIDKLEYVLKGIEAIIISNKENR